MADPANFPALFGRAAAVEESAPGRVNLIGEHTDYNGGAVLPMALPLRTSAQLALRSDDRVHAWSGDVGDGILEYGLGKEQQAGDWADFVRGITCILSADGHRMAGFDLRVVSEVPLGSGLSSSAALEIAILRGLRKLLVLSLTDLELARLGQRVENEFVGARVGIMDQMVSSLGEEGSALWIDTAALTWERVPMPAQWEIAVIDSGVRHAHAGGGYNERRRECEEAARLLGVACLADLDAARLRGLDALPQPLARRVRHVATEHARVAQAAAALQNSDATSFGGLLYDSHASLRDDFAVSIPQLDFLVETAAGLPGVFGARMTGGGFGGSVLLAVEAGRGRAAAHQILQHYAHSFPQCDGALRCIAAGRR